MAPNTWSMAWHADLVNRACLNERISQRRWQPLALPVVSAQSSSNEPFNPIHDAGHGRRVADINRRLSGSISRMMPSYTAEATAD